MTQAHWPSVGEIYAATSRSDASTGVHPGTRFRPSPEFAMWTVTDEVGTSGSITVDERWEIPDAIRPWYPDAPADVAEEAARTVDALGAGDESIQPYEAEAYLGVSVTHHS